MKRFLLASCLMSIITCSFGQDPNLYYDKSYRKNRPIHLQNMDVTQERWYFGLEAAFKENFATLTNNFDGLLHNSNTSNVIWGGELGFNHDNKWAVELGYIANQTGTSLEINSGRGFPYIINRSITLQTIPIRYKKNIWTIDKATKTASVWVSGGILVSPNSQNQKLSSFLLTSGTNYVRGTDGKVTSFDTLKLVGNSNLTNHSLIQLEAAVELTGQITEGLYVNVFVRSVFGQNSLIRSDVEYRFNSVVEDRSSHFLDGFNYSFGLGFRYDYGKAVKYKSRMEE